MKNVKKLNKSRNHKFFIILNFFHRSFSLLSFFKNFLSMTSLDHSLDKPSTILLVCIINYKKIQISFDYLYNLFSKYGVVKKVIIKIHKEIFSFILYNYLIIQLIYTLPYLLSIIISSLKFEIFFFINLI